MKPTKKRNVVINRLERKRILKHKLWRLRQYIHSIKQEDLLNEISQIVENIKFSRLSIMQNNGNVLRLSLNDNIRQKIYKILLNRLIPLSTSDSSFDDLIEEIKKKIKD